MTHVHILGICGTFMGSLALIAREAGFRVTGSDQGVYPPMSTQLEAAGIGLMEGYLPEHLDPEPDVVIVGNVMSRGNPVVEAVLDRGLVYTSGPRWLAENILRDRWTLAVSGTHGKTTTSSLLAHLLDHAGLEPGFLIGGVPGNFGISARLGGGRFFVVEADEYDTAFFDKRSKFVHYRPKTLILNNLEFDHVDIFPDLDAITRQFHHLVRTVPGAGRLIVNAHEPNLDALLEIGAWTPIERFGEAADAAWRAVDIAADGGRFAVLRDGEPRGEVAWKMLGRHNVYNALAAVAAAAHAGAPPAGSIEALASFRGIKRRMEVRAEIDGVTLYDDFAHHPTAIRTTLDGLRARSGADERILAAVDFASHTMRRGVHREMLAEALAPADRVFLHRSERVVWALEELSAEVGGRSAGVHESIDALADAMADAARPGDHLITMSSGSFGGLIEKVTEKLRGGKDKA